MDAVLAENDVNEAGVLTLVITVDEVIPVSELLESELLTVLIKPVNNVVLSV